MFSINDNTTVYIACLPQAAAGGTELLHQLCNSLNRRNIKAYMYYNCIEKFEGNPVADRFEHYGTKYVEEIEENENNILIVPELLIKYLDNYKNIRKCIWWLGINHYLVATELMPHKYLRVIYHWILTGLHIKKPMSFGKIRKQGIINWAQCWYAVAFLERKGLNNVAYLSDYIADSFVSDYQHNKFDCSKKEDYVIYNPKRNTKYVEKLKKYAPHIKFVAIENMSPAQVKETMQKAKVYIDFGSHPGKDRMPRESAMQGCCVLTSTLGSAHFYDDVPIPTECKYDRTNKNVGVIIKKIEQIFSNYESEAEKFDGYRNYIMGEKEQFEKDIDKLFVKRNRV